jgi:hypothetical protein
MLVFFLLKKKRCPCFFNADAPVLSTGCEAVFFLPSYVLLLKIKSYVKTLCTNSNIKF